MAITARLTTSQVAKRATINDPLGAARRYARAMSLPVSLEALHERVESAPDPTFLVTLGADGRPHVVSVIARFDGDRLVAGAGRQTSANVTTSPAVTLLWPEATDGYSLIVDGTAEVLPGDDPRLTVTPTTAVLHRRAGTPGEGPGCIAVVPAASTTPS
jgi:hypothetical protein